MLASPIEELGLGWAVSPCSSCPLSYPAPIPQLSATGYCIVLSLQGGDGGASSSGNVSGVAPATPAGGSRSSSRNLGSSGPEKEEGKKVRRQWESWSTEDKNTFFEGLYEVSCRHEARTHSGCPPELSCLPHVSICCIVVKWTESIKDPRCGQGSCHVLPGAVRMMLLPKALSHVSYTLIA